MSFFHRLWIGVGLALVLPALALAQPKFPPLTGRVVDDAQILSPATEANLTAELAALEQKTGHQVVVATLPDLQGYEIEDYGYQLLRTWAIGRKGQNDGAILIVAPNQRKVRIEVGYGLEPVLTDAMSSFIIQRAILPPFKEGHLEQGVVDGTEAIVKQLGLSDADQASALAEATVAQSAMADDYQGDPGDNFPLFIFIGVVFWLLAGLLRAFGARRLHGGRGLWWMLPYLLTGPGFSGGSSGGSSGGGWSSGGGGGGGFSGGGGSGGGGGASGSW